MQPYVNYGPLIPVFGEVTATADASTTSGTAALLGGMTTSLGAGTYIVWFTTSAQSNGTNSTGTFQLFANGSAVAASSRTSQPYDGGTLAAANATSGVALQATVVVPAGSTWTVQVEFSTSGGTTTSHQRTMTWLKVGQ